MKIGDVTQGDLAFERGVGIAEAWHIGIIRQGFETAIGRNHAFQGFDRADEALKRAQRASQQNSGRNQRAGRDFIFDDQPGADAIERNLRTDADRARDRFDDAGALALRVGRADVRAVEDFPLRRAAGCEPERAGQLTVAGNRAPPFFRAFVGFCTFGLEANSQQVLQGCDQNQQYRRSNGDSADHRIERDQRQQKQRCEGGIQQNAGRGAGDKAVELFERARVAAQLSGGRAEFQTVFKNVAAELVIEPNTGAQQHQITRDLDQGQRTDRGSGDECDDDQRFNTAERNDGIENLQGVERRRQHQNVDERTEDEGYEPRPAHILQHPPRRAHRVNFQVTPASAALQAAGCAQPANAREKRRRCKMQRQADSKGGC